MTTQYERGFQSDKNLKKKQQQLKTTNLTEVIIIIPGLLPANVTQKIKIKDNTTIPLLPTWINFGLYPIPILLRMGLYIYKKKTKQNTKAPHSFLDT